MADERPWVIYRRKRVDAAWHFVFVLPPGVSEIDAEVCIQIYEETIREGYRLLFLLVRQYPAEIKASFYDERERAQFIP